MGRSSEGTYALEDEDQIIDDTKAMWTKEIQRTARGWRRASAKTQGYGLPLSDSESSKESEDVDTDGTSSETEVTTEEQREQLKFLKQFPAQVRHLPKEALMKYPPHLRCVANVLGPKDPLGSRFSRDAPRDAERT
jgi:hypothetical protein